ncbi:GTPase ObgE [Natroniella sulfidigena]|uniref:GTPase ObgE n=1 Tax=Natroniella sulfidigena TaxID=723921 RepID=UPI002009DD33|nr:GTPase ObgE [Natroniella sulfidigena]MCK8815882.1 GTPase ObgE [Natroniella sulfidigena]
MFVDEVKIEVKGGDGGDGMTSFRREKFVSAGGPDGGDGGHGGDVIFKVDEGLNTLLDFRERNKYEAESGERGGSKKQHGKDGDDLVVFVPPGTTVIDVETGETIADLIDDGQKVVVAKGGRGGRGNTRFKSSTKQAPRFSENGEPGESKELKLELKLLADVGLVGYPSVGKSTLISRVSAAKPEIGAYHFTTLKPNLGVVKVGDYDTFVMADIPGLIEGAHQGVGLGDDFLRHIERTKVIVHILDISGIEGRDPLEDFEKINHELKEFNPDLLDREQLVVANKMDLPQAEKNLAEIKPKLEEMGYQVIPISAVTGTGVDELVAEINKLVKEAPDFFAVEEVEEEVIIRGPQPGEIEQDFEVERVNDTFKVTGDEIERKIAMADLSTEEGLRYLIKTFEKMGVEDALQEAGIKEGMTVDIDGLQFEYREG